MSYKSLTFFSVVLFCAAYAPSFIAAEVTLKPVPIEASSAKEDLRRKIFGTDLAQRQCKTISTDPRATVEIAPDVEQTIQKITTSINSRSDKTFKNYFNPRLKVNSGKAMGALDAIRRIAGEGMAVSNYRIMALNSPDGSTDAIECPDTGVMLHPLYGYPLTIGVWLQATGDKEVARVFFELVPSSKDWTIGAWHVQQWTHASKDFAMWYELASVEAQAKRTISAYIASDIAVKLLDGGGFLVFPVKKDAESFRDQQLNSADFMKAVSETFAADKVVYASSLFAQEGAGLLVRFEVKEELSAKAINAHCQDRLKTLSQKDWSKVLVGMRCAYNFPREKASADGVLGGIYMPFKG